LGHLPEPDWRPRGASTDPEKEHLPKVKWGSEFFSFDTQLPPVAFRAVDVGEHPIDKRRPLPNDADGTGLLVWSHFLAHPLLHVVAQHTQRLPSGIARQSPRASCEPSGDLDYGKSPGRKDSVGVLVLARGEEPLPFEHNRRSNRCLDDVHDE